MSLPQVARRHTAPNRYMLAEQMALIKDVACYRAQAKAEGKEEQFFETLYGFWFQNWPVVREWFSDPTHIEWVTNQHKAKIRNALWWAEKANTNVTLGHSWETGLSLAMLATIRESPKPRPRPSTNPTQRLTNKSTVNECSKPFKRAASNSLTPEAQPSKKRRVSTTADRSSEEEGDMGVDWDEVLEKYEVAKILLTIDGDV